MLVHNPQQVEIFYWTRHALDTGNFFQHLANVRALQRIYTKHHTYEVSHSIRILRVRGELESGRQDCRLPVLFEWCCVITYLVQKHTKGPNIRLLVNGQPTVQIDHLWGPILRRGIFHNIVLHIIEFLCISWCPNNPRN